MQHLFRLPTKAQATTAAAFAPSDITDLLLWLEYDYGVYTDTGLTTPAVVTNSVKGWQDRSGNGYNATEATNPPTLAADGLTFDGTNDVLRTARLTDKMGSGYTFFGVASTNDGVPTGTVNLIGGQQDTPSNQVYLAYYLNTSGNLQHQSRSGAGIRTANATTLVDGASSPFIVSVTANPSGNAATYFNGTAGATSVLSTITWANIASAGAETFGIGALLLNAATVGNHWNGKIKAILMYNRVLTAGELSSVHTYLGTKYSITIA